MPESLQKETLIKKETLTQVFSCEFWKISKNIFFTEHLRSTASGVQCILLTTKLSVFLPRSFCNFSCYMKLGKFV